MNEWDEIMLHTKNARRLKVIVDTNKKRKILADFEVLSF